MSTASPCTGVCSVDAAKVCRGCGRTLDEIAAWSGANEARRAAIRAAAMARLAAAAPRPIPGTRPPVG